MLPSSALFTVDSLLIELIGGGQAPSSQNVGSLLRTPRQVSLLKERISKLKFKELHAMVTKKSVVNGRGSAVNTTLDGSTYPG